MPVGRREQHLPTRGKRVGGGRAWVWGVSGQRGEGCGGRARARGGVWGGEMGSVREGERLACSKMRICPVGALSRAPRISHVSNASSCSPKKGDGGSDTGGGGREAAGGGGRAALQHAPQSPLLAKGAAVAEAAAEQAAPAAPPSRPASQPAPPLTPPRPIPMPEAAAGAAGEAAAAGSGASLVAAASCTSTVSTARSHASHRGCVWVGGMGGRETGCTLKRERVRWARRKLRKREASSMSCGGGGGGGRGGGRVCRYWEEGQGSGVCARGEGREAAEGEGRDCWNASGADRRGVCGD